MVKLKQHPGCYITVLLGMQQRLLVPASKPMQLAANIFVEECGTLKHGLKRREVTMLTIPDHYFAHNFSHKSGETA